MIKRLRHDFSDDESNGKDVIVPDLIVHRVGKRENLLVVEVNKSTNRDLDADIWKLKGMRQHAGANRYLVGLNLVIDDKAGTAPRCDVYVDAALDEKRTEWMRTELGDAG